MKTNNQQELSHKYMVLIDRDLVSRCLKLVNQDIEQLVDNPMLSGRVPDYIDNIRIELENVLRRSEPNAGS